MPDGGALNVTCTCPVAPIANVPSVHCTIPSDSEPRRGAVVFHGLDDDFRFVFGEAPLDDEKGVRFEFFSGAIVQTQVEYVRAAVLAIVEEFVLAAPADVSFA